jgi:glycosyltransferase involved in cell wall biosynthesis
MKRILFIHNGLTRFVQIDRDLLAERYSVTELHARGLSSFRALRLRRLVGAHDLVFCWFASWHAVLPVLLARRLGRPSVVVVGGYDTASIPQADYGSQRGGLRRLLARTIIRTATHLITHSAAARTEAISNAGADPDRISVIYLGVSPVPSEPPMPRERLVLTVGNVWRENLLRKGLLPFVQAAAHLPDVRFVHVGRWCDESIADLRRVAPPNVRFLGFLPDPDLWKWYAQASVYVQASLHEGFGLSVAEAMTAGAIPVVTRAGALPEVVGDTGVYTASSSSADLAEAIRQGLALDADARQRSRARVLQRFPMDRRRTLLARAIDQLLFPQRPRNDQFPMTNAQRMLNA